MGTSAQCWAAAAIRRVESCGDAVSHCLRSFMRESDENYQVSSQKPFLKLQQPLQLPPQAHGVRAEALRGVTRLQREPEGDPGTDEPVGVTAVPQPCPRGQRGTRWGRSRLQQPGDTLCPSLHRQPGCQGIAQHTIQTYLYVHDRGKRLCCQDQSFNLMPLTPL